jgi:hypothetical protein
MEQVMFDRISALAPSRIGFLLGFATLCLAIALCIAWVLGVTLFFPKGDLATLIVERADLIRAHIDFLMMAQFLFIFALLFRQYAIDPPRWIIGAACFGAFFNPLSFLMRAFQPKIDLSIVVEPHFPIKAALSFTLTTIGFLAAGGLAVYAAQRLDAARAARNDQGRLPAGTTEAGDAR